jgi:tripartite-type tricarboxylate transporter receptor subunit TctC
MASQTGSAVGNTVRRLRPWAVVRAAIWGISCVLFVVNLRSNPTSDSDNAYPLKPITVIVPFNTGGESDVFARMIQHAASQHKLLGQELVIQNIGGAGATIGSGRARKADPDGYTMMILHEALLTAQSSGKVSYGAESFEPIAATGKTRLIIAVRDDSPYQTLPEIMAAAAETPDELVFAANLGAPVHYAGLILERQQPGSAFRYTQTGGGAQRFEAVVGGHADVSAFSLGEYIAYKAGGIRAIAISAPQRDPRVPEILTAREQGFDFVHANMHFWWFPKGTDQAKIDRIAKFLEDCMQTDIVQKQLATRLSDPLILTGDKMHDELADRILAIQSVDSASPDVLPNIPLIILAATSLCLAGMLLPMFKLLLGMSPSGDRQTQTEMEDGEPPLSGSAKTRYWATVTKVALLTILYILSLEYLSMDYRWLTMGFICLFGIVIGSWGIVFRRLRPFPIFLDVVVLVPFWIYAVFQSGLHIELP